MKYSPLMAHTLSGLTSLTTDRLPSGTRHYTPFTHVFFMWDIIKVGLSERETYFIFSSSIVKVGRLHWTHHINTQLLNQNPFSFSSRVLRLGLPNSWLSTVFIHRSLALILWSTSIINQLMKTKQYIIKKYQSK